jgi:hypothetical protein
MVEGGGYLTHPVNDLLVFTAANIAVGVNYSDSSETRRPLGRREE